MVTLTFGKIKINFRSPITIEKGTGNEYICWNWKKRMKKAAREGKALTAVKYIKLNLDVDLKTAKYLWDTKYKPKYYNPPKNYNYE